MGGEPRMRQRRSWRRKEPCREPATTGSVPTNGLTAGHQVFVPTIGPTVLAALRIATVYSTYSRAMPWATCGRSPQICWIHHGFCVCGEVPSEKEYLLCSDREAVVQYITECCSATRKDETLPLVTIQIDLENIMLSEIIQKKLISRAYEI